MSIRCLYTAEGRLSDLADVGLQYTCYLRKKNISVSEKNCFTKATF